MAPIQPPFFMQTGSHPAQVFRRAFEFPYAVSCVRAGGLAVSVGAGLAVSVASGEALIFGTENALRQGAYHVLNDAAYSIALAAADPALPRDDLIVARVRDQEFSGASSDWDLVAVTGVPAAAPADPTPPANSLTLARVRVPALAVAPGTITDLRVNDRFAGRQAGGVYHRALQGSNISGIAGTATQVGGAGLTAALPASRRIRSSLRLYLDQTVVTDSFLALARRGGTTLASLRLPRPPVANVAFAYYLDYLDLPAAGSHVYDWAIQRESGTGTATAYAGTEASFEDVGPF